LLFSKPQAATTHVDELNKSQHEPSSIKGMTAFCSLNINEVSAQVKYENEIYRSRFDIYLSSGVENLVSSRFDRRFFQLRVHLIETKDQFNRSKGFDRRVSGDKN